MKISKNASKQFLIETDRKGLMLLKAALLRLEDCEADCPLFEDEGCGYEPTCEQWTKQIDEALDPDLQRR